MHGVITWLTALPTTVLYVILAVVGAAENVFPPLPADTVVALGSWLAARGKGSAVAAFLAPVLGNIAGATGMYLVGRRHGSDWMHRKFPALASPDNERRLQALYGKYGLVALVLSRFIPGVRAIVPPFAGAMRVPAGRAIAAMAIASAAWYGTISWLAFRAGSSDWGAIMRLIRQSGTIAAGVAALLLLAGVGYWAATRRRASAGS
jgi:membrane protein DedA with SNARE-associated domain